MTSKLRQSTFLRDLKQLANHAELLIKLERSAKPDLAPQMKRVLPIHFIETGKDNYPTDLIPPLNWSLRNPQIHRNMLPTFGMNYFFIIAMSVASVATSF